VPGREALFGFGAPVLGTTMVVSAAVALVGTVSRGYLTGVDGRLMLRMGTRVG
jgi:hypothetical protein